MLTIEMLRQNPTLSGLSDNVLTAIADMSKNDEATVIGTRIGELHGQYDTDILGITGIAKNDGEKSYDYLKRVLGTYKEGISQQSKLQSDLQQAKAEVDTLKAKIADGSADAALKQQLKDAKAQVAQLQQQLTTVNETVEKNKKEFDEKLKSTHVDYAFASAVAGLKFKDIIPESVRPVLLASAKAEVLAKGTPDFVDDGKGGTVFVLRGQDGNVLNNVKNNLNPYTLSELLMETSLKDALDTGKVQTGGGTGGHTTEVSGVSLDFSAAKNQVDADKIIETYLLSKGYTRDSVEFSEQSMQIRSENNIANLPIR